MMLSTDTSVISVVMARLDRATQPARVHAPQELYAHLDGPLSRAMTNGGVA